MRVVFSFLFVGVLAFSCANAKLVEGIEYEKLPFVVENMDDTVIKVARYNCQFCYKFDEHVVGRMVPNLKSVKYIPYHSAFGAEFGKQVSQVLAVMIAKDMEKGISLVDENSMYNRTNMAIYRAFHSKGERWGDDSSKDRNVKKFLKTALAPTKMSVKEYEENLKEPKVVEILDSWGLDSDDMAARLANVQGVPSFIVDGRYIIKPEAIRTPEQLADMIEELSNLD